MIEAGKKGTWPGGSRWTKPFLRLNRDNTLSRDRDERLEQDGQGLSDLDYWRKLTNEVPNTLSRRLRVKGGSIRKSDQKGELPWTILTS